MEYKQHIMYLHALLAHACANSQGAPYIIKRGNLFDIWNLLHTKKEAGSSAYDTSAECRRARCQKTVERGKSKQRLALELPDGDTVLAILQPHTQLFELRANAVGQRELARRLEFAAHINKQSDEWLALL